MTFLRVMVKGKEYKAYQEASGDPWLGYVLLPYGMYYEKTRVLLDASAGDILRFFNGPDVRIESVMLIPCDKMCNFLCKMKYGITWDIAYQQWLRYARLEGHGKDILDKEKCILVIYNAKDKV